MKKTFAFVLGVFFLFQSSVALAADEVYGMPSRTMEPAIKSLLSFNRWLYQNGFEGINYINDNYYAAREQAIKWDKDALLLRVWVSSSKIGDGYCEYQFGSANKPTEIFDSWCVDPKTSKVHGEIVKTDAVDPDDLFDLPNKNLRKFVSDIFASTVTLRHIRDTFQGDSRPGVFATLKKVDGEVRWTWELVNSGKNYGMDVFADAAFRDGNIQYSDR